MENSKQMARFFAISSGKCNKIDVCASLLAMALRRVLNKCPGKCCSGVVSFRTYISELFFHTQINEVYRQQHSKITHLL
jgi:hypothetical protein